jgi:Zn-dependent protease/predicted transcriptional regulator
MKSSWKIGTFAGIDVFMHATFLLIIGFVGLTNYQSTGTWTGVLEGILFTLVLFGFVVLHEFGHALTARRYGIKTRDITLYPIGGVARLERMPDKPTQEFWVALAGPAVNVALAIVLFGWQVISGALTSLAGVNLSGGSFVERLLAVNITLALFNLIPAFPMDGGRILRSMLAMRLEYPKATQIAAAVGQGMAFVLGLIGLFTNPFLIVIAVFVWIGAGQEASQVQIKSKLDGIPVGRALLTDFRSLSPDDPMNRAVAFILSGSQTDFPVVKDGVVVGLLRRDDILAALSRKAQGAPVSSIMRRDFASVEVNDALELALTRLQSSGYQTMPVTSLGHLVGLITADNIAEFLMIRSALRQSRSLEAA